MKRGAVTKSTSKLVNVWLPERILPYLDLGVEMDDSDRSKFIRKAIREKLARSGISTADEGGGK